MLATTLGANLSANMLAGKAKIPGQGVIRAGKETTGARQDL